MNRIKFSQHAMQRALERKLWDYLKKETFYFDAQVLDLHRAIVDDVVYAFVKWNDWTIITTIYRIDKAELLTYSIPR